MVKELKDVLLVARRGARRTRSTTERTGIFSVPSVVLRVLRAPPRSRSICEPFPTYLQKPVFRTRSLANYADYADNTFYVGNSCLMNEMQFD